MNLWQLQYLVTYSQSVPAVLGPQEAVQIVTQQTQTTLYNQRKTARRAPRHQEGGFLAATDQYEAAAGQNLVNPLARHKEALNDNNVEMLIRQLEHAADARLSQKKKNCDRDSLRKQTKLLKISEKFWGRK